ncbi:MAG TPA: hypothetical protein VK476_01555 [Flavobacterium sp.]|nr:hypothetical protein [Flavobacterium sp.]
MKMLKNIGVGFLVSFMGSVPLGYLNVIGYQVYIRNGLHDTLFFLLGVMSVEALVIYFTLISMDKLMKNKKILKWIEGFSVLFMFVIAYIFYASSNATVTQSETLNRYAAYPPYIIGIILSCFNFIQLPFWTGWNLYLLNGKHIVIEGSKKYFYVVGTIVGTFVGMMTLILCLDLITGKTGFISKYLMGTIVPLAFAGFGVYQGIKFYRKYFH